MKPRYRLLIFDFDGTLVDTVGDIAHHANSVLKDYGYPSRPVDSVKQAIGWGVHELLKALAPELAADTQKLEEAVAVFKKRYREKPVLQTAAFPDVRRMLAGPLGPFKKVIVTNKPQDLTEEILGVLGLGGHFQRVIGMHAGYPPKPDPASTLSVMRDLGAGPEETLFIGDSLIDAETSRAAGIDFAWVRYGYDRLNGCRPAMEFSSAAEWASLAEA